MGLPAVLEGVWGTYNTQPIWSHKQPLGHDSIHCTCVESNLQLSYIQLEHWKLTNLTCSPPTSKILEAALVARVPENMHTRTYSPLLSIKKLESKITFMILPSTHTNIVCVETLVASIAFMFANLQHYYYYYYFLQTLVTIWNVQRKHTKL